MPWKLFASKADPIEASVREAMQALGGSVIQMNGDDLLISLHGEQKRLNLANIRPRALRAPEAERVAGMVAFLRSTLTATPLDAKSTSFEDIRRKLMPRIGIPFAEDQRDKIVSLPFLPPILIRNLVVDGEESAMYVNPSHLQGWGKGFEELFEVALTNLRGRTDLRAWVRPKEIPGMMAYETGDTYDAARMLLIREIIHPWPSGGAVIMVPNRDVLLCVRLDDISCLQAVQKTIGIGKSMYDEGGYQISDQPFYFDGREWERLGVEFGKREVGIAPGPRLVQALERLARKEGPL